MSLSSIFSGTVFNWLGRVRFLTTPPTLANDSVGEMQGDSKGNLLVRVVANGPETGAYGAAAYSQPAGPAFEYKRVVRSGAGTLFQIRGFNDHASNDRYLQVFDSITDPPANGTVPKESILVKAKTNFSLDIPEGRPFSTGIFVAVSSTGDELTIDSSATFFFVARYASV